MRYFDLLLERKKERDKYLENIKFYLNLIKEFFLKELGEKTRVFIFGSYLTEKFGPNSDIDILVITDKDEINSIEKTELILKIKKLIGFVNPFEFHIITQKEYNEWYSNFIKEKREI